jgi:hypothetical protein
MVLLLFWGWSRFEVSQVYGDQITVPIADDCSLRWGKNGVLGAVADLPPAWTWTYEGDNLNPGTNTVHQLLPNGKWSGIRVFHETVPSCGELKYTSQ